jgi:hypothetical protein
LVDPDTGEPVFDDIWKAEDNDCSGLRRGTPENPASTPNWTARGHIFYYHNHPLYLHRSVSVYHKIESVTVYWKFMPQTVKWGPGIPGYYDGNLPPNINPKPCWWDFGRYDLVRQDEEPIKSSRSGTFSPKDDCWSISSPQIDKQTPINSIGIFTLPGPQDFMFAYPTTNSFPSKNRLSPEVKVDKDD